MSREPWNRLIGEIRQAHTNHTALTDFVPFPDDLREQEVSPFHIPSSDLLQADTGLFTGKYTALRDAVAAAAPQAHWRQTYKGTDIGQDFLDRFGCYCVIGGGGPYSSAQMWAWVVYMPPGLHYPWHHHPGEEMYLVLAGEAEFMKEGGPNEVLRAGDVSGHASNQPHAMETGDHPVLAYVVWRNGFDTPPVLTPGEEVA